MIMIEILSHLNIVPRIDDNTPNFISTTDIEDSFY
jgi:hypothetical protein